MNPCYNHPEKKAYSICHNCGKSYCGDCLDEGDEYFFCKSPECQAVLKKERPEALLPEEVVCPNCQSAVELLDEEMISGRVHCTACESMINFTVNPPEISQRENYVEFLSSLNQADIGMIKSLLDDGGISYHIFGENFLSVRPLLEPTRLFVREDQVEEAREILKDFDLRIWGYSINR